MNIYEAPVSESTLTDQNQIQGCGFNCNNGFGLGIVIAMIGPLPGPT